MFGLRLILPRQLRAGMEGGGGGGVSGPGIFSTRGYADSVINSNVHRNIIFKEVLSCN